MDSDRIEQNKISECILVRGVSIARKSHLSELQNTKTSKIGNKIYEHETNSFSILHVLMLSDYLHFKAPKWVNEEWHFPRHSQFCGGIYLRIRTSWLCRISHPGCMILEALTKPECNSPRLSFAGHWSLDLAPNMRPRDLLSIPFSSGLLAPQVKT